jgi:S1-C subfamily serine protease
MTDTARRQAANTPIYRGFADFPRGDLLDTPGARSLIACPREVGAECPHCAVEIVLGDPIMVCQACGTVHHRTCWRAHERCGAYSCAPARRSSPEPRHSEPVLTITHAELDRAVPLAPAARQIAAATRIGSAHSPQRSPVAAGVNGLAIASFICALAGIPLFGIITGFVAVVLAVIALGAIRATSQRGLGLAIAGLLLGLVDVVGWIALIVWMLPLAGHQLSADLHFSELPPDLSVIQDLAPPLQRAMRANVLIERQSGLAALGGKAIGSGVILQMNGREALIVTNRHVIDDDFPSSRGSAVDSNRLSRLGKMSVSMLGQQQVVGRVVWLAPAQIDLALLRARCAESGQARDASWKRGRPMNVGASVFAIGNPYRLGWTHTQGVISQMRTQDFDLHRVRVIQTQASINPGNSGGGLYDNEGFLLGINTWTTDKSLSEGIGFAISLDSLLELAPPPLEPDTLGAKAQGKEIAP